MNNPLILVTGTTGKQGGAVVNHLLQHNFQVRALVRNLTAPAARTLADRGVKIVQGDLDDRESLESAVAGAYGVFSVQAFSETDFDLEVRQGKSMDLHNSTEANAQAKTKTGELTVGAPEVYPIIPIAGKGLG
jgi:uncharacterized protein YbjT (DUF2867 family)